MMIEGNMSFSSQQSLTGTSDVISTNVYDAGSAKKVFGGSAGLAPKVAVTTSASGGTSPTFRARLVGADNAALTTNPIILADSGVSRVLTATDVPYAVELIPAEQLDSKQYYGVIYTQSGTSPTATVNANMVLDAQSAGLK
jgi:hypothetical protein